MAINRRVEELLAASLGVRKSIELCNEFDAAYASGGSGAISSRGERLLRNLFGTNEGTEARYILESAYGTGGSGTASSRLEDLLDGAIGRFPAVEAARLIHSAYDSALYNPTFNLPLLIDAKDASWNFNHGTIHGGTSFTGGGILLDGTTGYISVPLGITGIGTGWTFAIGFKTNDTPAITNGGLIGQSNGVGPDASGIIHYFLGGGIGADADTGDVTLVDYGGYNDNVWRTAAARLAADGNLTIWVNGVLTATGSSNPYSNIVGQNVNIGRFEGTGEYFNGTIRNARGWRSALTNAEMALLTS